jgi:hypothetical protein
MMGIAPEIGPLVAYIPYVPARLRRAVLRPRSDRTGSTFPSRADQLQTRAMDDKVMWDLRMTQRRGKFK